MITVSMNIESKPPFKKKKKKLLLCLIWAPFESPKLFEDHWHWNGCNWGNISLSNFAEKNFNSKNFDRGTFLNFCLIFSLFGDHLWENRNLVYCSFRGKFNKVQTIPLIFFLYFSDIPVGQYWEEGCKKLGEKISPVKRFRFRQNTIWSLLTHKKNILYIFRTLFLALFDGFLAWIWEGGGGYVSIASKNNVGQLKMDGTIKSFCDEVLLKNKHFLNQVWQMKAVLIFRLIWINICSTLISLQVAYFTAIIPYLVLITLLIRGVTLPGAYNGIMYFITPQWDKLLELKVWYNAIIQSFFSLGVGYGSLMMLASYNDFKHDIYRDAWIMSLADTLTSLLAGFTVFSILGYLAHELGKDVHDVVTAGNGLAFITYPEVIAKFDIAPQVFSVLFFLMLFTLGVGSLAADTGVVITVVCDQFPTWKRPVVTFCICLISFLVGLVYVTPGGQWILELVDFFVGGFVRFGLVVVEVIALNWIYGTTTFIQDVNFMLGRNLGWYWRICWSVVIPVSLSIILVYSIVDLRLPTMDGQYFPTSVYACGWMIPLAALLLVILGFAHAVHGAAGQSFKQKLKTSFCPKKSWGPKKTNHHEDWEKLNKSKNIF
ncbi:unnamed protein product, partial [Meganyctiphanes norvegica]